MQDIANDTTPLSEGVVPSGVPVRYVPEVVAGTAKRLKVQPGERVVSARNGTSDRRLFSPSPLERAAL